MSLYLAADHDVSDFGFAVAAVRLVVSCADGQDKVPRVALALSHQEAAILAFLRQQLLGLPARQMPVEPSGKQNMGNAKMLDAQSRAQSGLTEGFTSYSSAITLFVSKGCSWFTSTDTSIT